MNVDDYPLLRSMDVDHWKTSDARFAEKKKKTLATQATHHTICHEKSKIHVQLKNKTKQEII